MLKSEQWQADILKVIKAAQEEGKKQEQILGDSSRKVEECIEDTERVIKSNGRELPVMDPEEKPPVEVQRIDSFKEPIIVKPFAELLREANEKIPGEVGFDDIFTPEEIARNREELRIYRKEFDSIHRLDEVDIIISALAGILSGALDCAFGGFIRPENRKGVPGPFSEYVGKLFDKALPPETIKELEKEAKVTYDAVNNRDTAVYVDGLSSYFHRLVSLGHDPILGFICGVLDELRGTMTTLDRKGRFVIQVMDVYRDRKAKNPFEAISKVFLHMLSDVNTPAGLPVPFMALFNKLQFGSIGEEKLNIAEMVQSMYGQGYDFRHFCSMSIPVMIIEVIVRVSYFIKRLYEGYSFRESIPFNTDHEKTPKLGAMLFIAHSASAAINAGKVALTQDPLNINYPQWLVFVQYSIKQVKWALIEKPKLRDRYVDEIISKEWDDLRDDIEVLWQDVLKDRPVIYHM